MPSRPYTELKRPDLKGEFICGHCDRIFCHSASLNRHRLDVHREDQLCLICNENLDPNLKVRRHMQMKHGFERVYTCGCCNWTFADKKLLQAHNDSMKKTGQPGEAKPIAISSRPPGSLSQRKLQSEKSVSPASETPPTTANSIDIEVEQTSTTPVNHIEASPLGLVGNTQTPNMMMPGAQYPVDWTSFSMYNPAFFPFMQQQQMAAANWLNLGNVYQPYLSENGSGSSIPNMNNNGMNQIEEDKEDDDVFIDVEAISDDDEDHTIVTESLAKDPSESSTNSGSKSGYGFSEDNASTCSTTLRSRETSPSESCDENVPPSSSSFDIVNLLAPKNRKRKSIDDVASRLYKKKFLMG